MHLMAWRAASARPYLQLQVLQRAYIRGQLGANHARLPLLIEFQPFLHLQVTKREGYVLVTSGPTFSH